MEKEKEKNKKKTGIFYNLFMGVNVAIFRAGLITCVLHEITHYIVAFLFYPVSKDMRNLVKSTKIIMTPHSFMWGMSLERPPTYVNDCILRVFVGLAPLLSTAAFIWAFIMFPAHGELEIACKFLVTLGMTNLWPSKPDWRTSIYNIQRIWNAYFAEKQAYDILAKKLHEKRGVDYDDTTKSKRTKKKGTASFKLPGKGKS